MKLVLLASMMASGAQLLPNVNGWTTPDVRTEAIVTAAILLGVASLIRRRSLRQHAQNVAASPLRDVA
ncbi:MAG TPA: hypothetical protein VKD69_16745 [Vicinamibacterales bacterium]|nr:hypothetical protein [Vicinamibacterales bacterium]